MGKILSACSDIAVGVLVSHLSGGTRFVLHIYYVLFNKYVFHTCKMGNKRNVNIEVEETLVKK